jgi:hypothetical protein
MNEQQSSSGPPAATITYGANTIPVWGYPYATKDAEPGTVVIIIAEMATGNLVRWTVTDFGLLDDMEAAIQHARTLATPARAQQAVTP